MVGSAIGVVVAYRRAQRGFTDDRFVVVARWSMAGVVVTVALALIGKAG